MEFNDVKFFIQSKSFRWPYLLMFTKEDYIEYPEDCDFAYRMLLYIKRNIKEWDIDEDEMSCIVEYCDKGMKECVVRKKNMLQKVS